MYSVKCNYTAIVATIFNQTDHPELSVNGAKIFINYRRFILSEITVEEGTPKRKQKDIYTNTAITTPTFVYGSKNTTSRYKIDVNDPNYKDAQDWNDAIIKFANCEGARSTTPNINKLLNEIYRSQTSDKSIDLGQVFDWTIEYDEYRAAIHIKSPQLILSETAFGFGGTDVVIGDKQTKIHLQQSHLVELRELYNRMVINYNRQVYYAKSPEVGQGGSSRLAQVFYDKKYVESIFWNRTFVPVLIEDIYKNDIEKKLGDPLLAALENRQNGDPGEHIMLYDLIEKVRDYRTVRIEDYNVQAVMLTHAEISKCLGLKKVIYWRPRQVYEVLVGELFRQLPGFENYPSTTKIEWITPLQSAELGFDIRRDIPKDDFVAAAMDMIDRALKEGGMTKEDHDYFKQQYSRIQGVSKSTMTRFETENFKMSTGGRASLVGLEGLTTPDWSKETRGAFNEGDEATIKLMKGEWQG